MFKRSLQLIVATAAVTVAANAAEPKSFNALVGAGYEVKAVTLVPVEVAKRDQADFNGDTVAVTLQKGGAIAVCYFGFGNWISLNKKSLENANLCVLS